MQLEASYDFLELTQADGICVSSAREKGTGKLVQIHLFPEERSQDADQIRQRIIGLPDAARRMIIRFGKEGTNTYFVTEPLPIGVGIRNWVGEKLARPSTADPPPPPVPVVAKEGPGEFTRTYNMQDLSDSPSKPAPLAPVPAAPASSTTGEFTRMYTQDELRNLTSSLREPASEIRSTPPPVVEPPPPAPSRDTGPGLETFIFERSVVRRPAPVLSPKTPAPAPTPPQPLFAHPEPAPPPVQPIPTRHDTFEAPQPIYVPPPTPAPPPAQVQRPVLPPAALPRVERPASPETRFDWRVAVLLAAALLVIVAAVIVLVG
jgi:hypothetical protein